MHDMQQVDPVPERESVCLGEKENDWEDVNQSTNSNPEDLRKVIEKKSIK